jgi:hypothetical protein
MPYQDTHACLVMLSPLISAMLVAAVGWPPTYTGVKAYISIIKLVLFQLPLKNQQEPKRRPWP